MLNLGTVRLDAPIRIPFWTVTGDNPPIPVTPSASWVDGDFEFYKDGVLTAIAAAATTPSTDLDTTPVGGHRLVIDPTQDADFTAGSSWECWLRPASTTVDGAAVNVCLAVWSFESLEQKFARLFAASFSMPTTIAAITSQVVFTIVLPPQDDGVYDNWLALFRDQANDDERGSAVVDTQVGNTITLRSAPEFTIAAGDYVVFVPGPKVADNRVYVAGIVTTEVEGDGSDGNPWKAVGT